MKKYAIGIDYGTLSGRAVLVDTETGNELAESVLEYPHGVMDESLPSGRALPEKYALQHPGDYIEVLKSTVPDVLSKAGVSAADVAGIGIDFTACTVLPVREDGTPLCFDEKYADEPHAYVKLWKHHAAQPEADEINLKAAQRQEKWLAIYGGKISSEWVFPKVLQVLREAPEIYRDTARFIEAGDWLSWMLTGTETHAAAFAGYKALWNSEDGYPSPEFLEAVDPGLKDIVGTKLSRQVLPVDRKAGVLNKYGAGITGLEAGTPVALPMIDGHAAMPALGITGEGVLMLIMGTSSCHIINSGKVINIPGVCGYVKDGVIPGFYTYEAGQACVGDGFDWFVRNCVPEKYAAEAREKGISIHKLLRMKASQSAPGQSGVIALDWFNGNRSVLDDSDLSGMILGLTLGTKPEDIYRALIEATAFGTRMIIESFVNSGIAINSITASGGIARKDEMMMQIYADVTGREINVAGTSQAGALGSAIYASVAGGLFDSVAEAADKLAVKHDKVYRPDPERQKAYDRLYGEYKLLHDYFGRGGNDVMKRLLKNK